MVRDLRQFARALALLALLLSPGLVAACTSTPPAPPPLRTPRALLRVHYHAGSPVSGPSPSLARGADAGRAEDALQASLVFIALEKLPENVLGPLGPLARLLIADDGASPIRPAAALLGGARAGPIPDAATFTAALERGDLGRAARVGELRGVLPDGITAAFEIEHRPSREADLTPAPGGERRDRLRVSLRRLARAAAGPALEAAIEGERSSERDGKPRRELVLVDAIPLGVRRDFALIVPCDMPEEEARAIALVGSVGPAPPPEGVGSAAHMAAHAACRVDLARLSALADEPTVGRPTPRAAPPDLERARRALLEEGARRVALFGIAQATGARLAEDIAITADEPLLATVTAAVALGMRALPSSPSLAGLIVEREAMRALASRSRASEEVVSADLFLLRRAGGAAWVEDGLDAILTAAEDLEDLDRRLLGANLALLDDPTPTYRARARDWLALRGKLPPGYDPLGSPEARRAALDHATHPDPKAGDATQLGGTKRAPRPSGGAP